MRSLPRKAEHLSFGWQVGEATNAHAVAEPAIDGRFDEIGGKESKRETKPTITVSLDGTPLFQANQKAGE